MLTLYYHADNNTRTRKARTKSGRTRSIALHQNQNHQVVTMKKAHQRGLGFADDISAARPGLQHCVEAALGLSDSLIDSVIDGLEITVARAHGARPASAPKPAAKLAIERLIAERAQMRLTFAAQLRAAMYGGVKAEAQAQPLLRFDDLQLLAEDELDESIEAAWAQQEIVLAVEDVLPALDALVSTLLGWITVQPQLNPLRPEVFVRALRGAMAEQIPDAEIRGALMTPAAGHLGTRMRKLYRELRDWLESQGIEPAGLPGSSAKAHEGSARGKHAAGGPPSSVAKTILTLDRLRKLLSGELDGPPGGAKDFLYTVPASLDALQDMQMVEAMVQRLAKRKQEGGVAPGASPPKRYDSKQIGKQLGEEVIRLMLESLIEDERMLLKVRQTLHALEPVLLRLAQIEPRFFSEKQHPARQFLDRITHRSLAFTAESDDGFHKFMRALEQAVAALLAIKQISADSFSQVLKILEDAWTREDKAQKARLEEAARALLHAEQRNLLATRLSQEFRERMSLSENTDIPAFVSDFLCGPWAQAMAESQLAYTDSTSINPNALMEDLIWSVQPRVARLNRTRLVELVPNLLARLREGLQVISYPPELIARFFDELISLHETALEGARAAPDAAAHDGMTPLSAPEGADETEEPWVGAKETAKSGFLDEDAVMPLDFSAADEASDAPVPLPTAGAELATRMWVELMFEGQWVRAQLTWVSPHRTLFMFNSAGGKAHSMSRRTLNRLRTQGLMRVISDGHLIDNALDAVAQVALRNSLEQPDK